MPLLLSSFVKYSLHNINSVFQFFIDFLINCTIFQDTCTNARLSKIQEWRIISFLTHDLCHFQISVSPYNQSPPFYLFKIYLLSLSCISCIFSVPLSVDYLFLSVHIHYQILFQSLASTHEEGMTLAYNYPLRFIYPNLFGKVLSSLLSSTLGCLPCC